MARLVKNPPAMQETWVGKVHWRRDKLLTPVFWPGESHGLCGPWVCKESHTTERLSLSLLHYVCVGLSGRRRVSTGSRLGPWVIISESPASGRPGSPLTEATARRPAYRRSARFSTGWPARGHRCASSAPLPHTRCLESARRRRESSRDARLAHAHPGTLGVCGRRPRGAGR